MDIHGLWQKTLPVRRGLLAVFLGLHLVAIVLNNLPWSPLVEATFDIYRPYLGLTGTVQDGWSMYGSVHHVDNHFQIVGTDADGRDFTITYPGQTRVGLTASRIQDFFDERDGSVLEAMGYGVPDDIREAFGFSLCRDNPRAASVRLEMISAEIPPLADWEAPPKIADYVTRTAFTTDCSLDA